MNFIFDIHAGVLSPEMREALWGTARSDAWHFFSGLRQCNKCQHMIQTPHSFPEEKIPIHDCVPRKPVVSELGFTQDLSLPALDPINSEGIRDILNGLDHKGVSPDEIKRAAPLLKTLFNEMIPK